MAETPLPPGAPGSPEPTGSAGAPPDPVAESTVEAIADAEPGPIEVSLTPAEVPAEVPAEIPAEVPVEVQAESPGQSPEEAPVEPAVASPAPTPAPPEEAKEPEAAIAKAAAEPEATPAPAPVAPSPLAPTPVAAAEPDAAAVEVPEPAPTPTIATTLEIPAAPGATPADGGEFDLLVEKLRTWFKEADIGGHWQKLQGPLKGFALLLVAVLALRLYARVVGTLDGIPILSGLLELTGLVYLIWFSSTRLVRTSERERVLAEWKQRWRSFSGRH